MKSNEKGMGLTPKESYLFQHLLTVERSTLGEISEYCGSTRQRLTQRIKSLSAKISPFGWIIEKKTGLGRGNKTLYSITKKF